jgi:DNA helicase-2/ATP-dependent DNA helicase PcrA
MLEDLNDAQAAAVTHGEGPMLVLAGAGTGKTRVLTRRIAWLIATRKAAPSEILGLTFTDKAAQEMEERVDRLVPFGYTDMTLVTFPRARASPPVRVRHAARCCRPSRAS